MCVTMGDGNWWDPYCPCRVTRKNIVMTFLGFCCLGLVIWTVVTSGNKEIYFSSWFWTVFEIYEDHDRPIGSTPGSYPTKITWSWWGSLWPNGCSNWFRTGRLGFNPQSGQNLQHLGFALFNHFQIMIISIRIDCCA